MAKIPYYLRVNRIYNEDCLYGMKRIQPGSVDMIIADLPYGVTNNRWDVIIDLQSMWEAYWRVLKPKGAIVLTAIQPFTTVLISSQPMYFRYDWIWEKSRATGFMNAKRAPLRSHESILVFYRKPPTYNPIKTINHTRKTSKGGTLGSSYGRIDTRTAYDSTDRYPRSVLHFPPDTRSRIHPTQKPEPLFEYLIRTYTLPGELVLDPTIGSGTTALACLNTRRNFIGFELDPEYYTMCKTEVEAAQSKFANSIFTPKGNK